jgi:hypothetical protein
MFKIGKSLKIETHFKIGENNKMGSDVQSGKKK